MKEFSVYTKIGCPYCTKVVAALGLQSSNLWSISWVGTLLDQNFTKSLVKDLPFPSSIWGRSYWWVPRNCQISKRKQTGLMEKQWDLVNTVEKSIDYAFDGKIMLDMYQYLKSIDATKADAREFLDGDTAKSINLMVYDLEDYLEGGKDSIHQQLREAYGYLGKPEARKIKNFLQSIIAGELPIRI